MLGNIRNIMRSNAAGFTLIEVLVAMVTVSVGLLGLAALQTLGMRYNYQSEQLSIATQLAYEMADRMRANLVGVGQGNYNAFSAKPLTDTGCNNTTSCTPAQLASHDAFEWYTDIAAALPGCTASISGSGGGSLFTITINWQEVLKGQAAQNKTYTLVVRP